MKQARLKHSNLARLKSYKPCPLKAMQTYHTSNPHNTDIITQTHSPTLTLTPGNTPQSKLEIKTMEFPLAIFSLFVSKKKKWTKNFEKFNSPPKKNQRTQKGCAKKRARRTLPPPFKHLRWRCCPLHVHPLFLPRPWICPVSSKSRWEGPLTWQEQLPRDLCSSVFALCLKSSFLVFADGQS